MWSVTTLRRMNEVEAARRLAEKEQIIEQRRQLDEERKQRELEAGE